MTQIESKKNLEQPILVNSQFENIITITQHVI